uniref:ANK_REP_REGION domain-containing protein n=1 Tax=Toxocara canis TaxID=6265 RepID=A0A183U1L6_TOXCA
LMRTSVNLMKAECVTIDDIKYLLNAGALIDEQDDNEESALMLAVKAGRCAVVRYLLERGADSDLQDAKQRTALHHAVALSALPLVNILLTDRNTNVNTLDESNCTPLMICAKHELIGVEIAELLIHAGADVSVDGRKVKPNYNGRTALHFAAQLCNLDMIRFLIRSGANKDAQDVLNQTPLFLAASEGHVEAVELLLNEGASKEISDYKERSPKDVAVEKNFPEVVERLTAQTVINDKKLNGQNQMHFKKNYKKSKRPLVKKVRPTVHHRIAPLEFLTPPQSDTSTFFSPVHMINDLRQHFSSITAPVPPAIVSPPYEFTLNRSLYSAKKIPNYSDRQQGVVRTSSSTIPNVFTDSLGSTLMEEVSSHLDDFNDHPSGYYV